MGATRRCACSAASSLACAQREQREERRERAGARERGATLARAEGEALLERLTREREVTTLVSERGVHGQASDGGEPRGAAFDRRVVLAEERVLTDERRELFRKRRSVLFSLSQA